MPVLTNGHLSGLNALRNAYAESRPVAIVIGAGEFWPGYLLDRFLAESEGDIFKARIKIPAPDDDRAIRDVARAIGFDLQDPSLASFENEFRNFLSYQKQNNRRTIICFEEIQHDARRVLEIALRIAELEAKEKSGLLLILSGPPALNDVLGESPFDAICAYAGQRIALGPFTLAETGEYIHRVVESAGYADVAQVFSVDAITRIHESCAGVPDRIDTLCSKCVQMIAGEGRFPITADLADKVGNLLWPEQVKHSSQAPREVMRINGASASIGSLVARMHGVVLKEQALHGHVLIGRSPLCDIHVSNSLVSRLHALVVRSATGVNLIDLGSTNGTFIGDRKVQQSTLQNGDVITIGDCKIAYVAVGNRDKVR